MDRLAEALRAGRSRSLQESLDDLYHSVRLWASASPQDDISILAFEVQLDGA